MIAYNLYEILQNFPSHIKKLNFLAKIFPFHFIIFYQLLFDHKSFFIT